MCSEGNDLQLRRSEDRSREAGVCTGVGSEDVTRTGVCSEDWGAARTGLYAARTEVCIGMGLHMTWSGYSEDMGIL